MTSFPVEYCFSPGRRISAPNTVCETNSKAKNASLKVVCVWRVLDISVALDATCTPLESALSALLGSHRSNVFDDEESKTRWSFRIMSDGFYVSLHFALLSAEKEPVAAKYKFAILKGEQEIYTNEGEDNFLIEEEEACFQNPKGISRFIHHELLISLLIGTALIEANEKHYKLVLRCQIILDPSYLQRGENVSIPKGTLLKDIENLQVNKNFSDIVLSVGGQEFHAHKALLAQRSPVFETMFQSDMTEKVQNKITIEDIDPEVFRVFLKYIYADAVDVNLSLAPHLLYVSEKYDLSRLKAACENALATSLVPENAVDLLLTAETYNASQLKEVTIKFICEFSQKVSKTKQWDKMLREKPDLARECLAAICAAVEKKH